MPAKGPIAHSRFRLVELPVGEIFQEKRFVTNSRLPIWFAFFVSVLLFAIPETQAAEREVWQFEPRTDVKLDVLLIEPENPSAVVIWMQGGKGKSNLSKKGIPDMIAKFGFTVAVPNAPSDQSRGMHPNFRITGEHVEDINAVVGWLKDKTNLPVWLVGMSMGTISAAHYAINGGHEIDGVSLLSCIVLSPKNKTIPAVNKMILDRIAVPLLAVAHKKDGCRVSPPAGAKFIVNKATASANARALFVSGGKQSGGGCGRNTHHSFAGIQKQVAKAVAEFIKANGR